MAQKFLQGIFRPAENQLARLYAESDAAALAVSHDEFAAWLPEHPSECRHLKDLILARACATGNAAAWDRFISLYRPKLYAAAIAITRDEAAGRELADSLYADLYGTRLQPDGHRVSKLDSFHGRGSLEGWLKTVLAQEHINRLRRERKFVPFDDALEPPSANPLPSDNEHSLSGATDSALSQLSVEDRFLLAAYYLDQRTLAEIGRLLAMHESTVSRRLERITTSLRKQILSALCQGGLSKRAAEEMLELDVRDLSINVREKLAQERSS